MIQVCEDITAQAETFFKQKNIKIGLWVYSWIDNMHDIMKYVLSYLAQKANLTQKTQQNDSHYHMHESI